MQVRLDIKDLARYPFLKESQQYVGTQSESLDQFLAGNLGRLALGKAADRVNRAITFRKARSGEEKRPEAPADDVNVKLEIFSYGLARVLVSCMKDRTLIDRLARYEARRAAQFLADEDLDKKAYVAESLGMDLNDAQMPLVAYVDLVAPLRDERWRLVNRSVLHGSVLLRKGKTGEQREIDELLAERIRVVLLRQLPLQVPPSVCEQVRPVTEQLNATYQQQMLRDLGPIDEGRYPPCISTLIAAVTEGKNLTHPGRFAMTAFLHTIGMSSTQIVELYCRAPDFDLQTTMYQVGHIAGGGGTEYSPPSCATMQTNGICVGKNALCSKVSSPLGYYRRKKE
ncbi:DNA primase regulatory subunit PriL [Methanosphaerula subterraneus]|uniref:DNA primase regulatory subunit PriL n=1 Tax=Methanosphaerula subterraneus TaxID=3350244 RepID=UPI003F86B296